jgi:hypothetical protein
MKQKTTLASLRARFYCCFPSLFFLLISFGLSAQSIVLDEGSKPVAGATATVKGTNKATTTNSSGGFSSYAGLTIPLNGKTSLSVNIFRGDGSNLDEVVVVGSVIKKGARKLGYSAETVKGPGIRLFSV